MGRFNLAFALVSIEYSDGSKLFFDEGSLEERITRIQKSFLSPKYVAVLEMLRLFDRKIGQLMEESTRPNFWKPEGDIREPYCLIDAEFIPYEPERPDGFFSGLIIGADSHGQRIDDDILPRDA